jgi:protein-S-isoprenylcysteine O-methyltransferase Ste14
VNLTKLKSADVWLFSETIRVQIGAIVLFMHELIRGIADRLFSMPPYGLAAMSLLLLYAVQAEIRFGAKARATKAGPSDRFSSSVLTLGLAVPTIGFVLAMKGRISMTLPGMPAIAWVGVILGAGGFALRLWSLLLLRERFTRTLLVQPGQQIERRGPYRFVRHPGYLGSLLCLNGIGLASGNALVVVASFLATCTAYGYRIHVEDAMLIRAFGETYEQYRRSTGALVPWKLFQRSD